MRVGRFGAAGLFVLFGLVGACVGDSSVVDGGADATTFDAPASETGADAMNEAGDAATDAKVSACNLSAPFGAPQPLSNVTTPTFNEDGIWLTPDGLNAYVSAQRADSGSYDLFTTTRAAADASFGSLVPLSGPVNTSLDERTPVVAADNLSLYYYASANKGMYAASRTNVSAGFGAGAAVATPLASATPYEAVTWISADGLTIYISSARDDGVNAHIMTATRASTSVPFGAPTAAGMPNSTATEGGAVLTGDQLTMYFLSTQSGNADIWRASRSTIQDGFGAATPVTELNGTSYNQVTWVSPDGCTVYVVHKPVDAGNTYDLLVASKPGT